MIQKSLSAQPAKDRLSFLWLAVAAACLVFLWGKWGVSLAGWLAPLFLLRFVRTQRVVRGYLLAMLVLAVTSLLTWTAIVDSPLMSGGLGFLASLPFLCDRLLAPRLKGFKATLVLPLAMTALEFLIWHNTSFGSVGSWAYAQHSNPELIQLASITGIWGLTFLTAWCASVINWAWEQSWEWPRIRRGATICSGVLLAVLAFGSLRLALAVPPAGTVRIHSFMARGQDPESLSSRLAELADTDLEAFRRETVSMYDPLIAGTAREARAGAQIVVWPELAALGVPGDIKTLILRGQQVARAENIYLAMVVWESNAKGPRLVIADPSGQIVIDQPKYAYGMGTPLNEVDLQTVDTPYGRLAGVLCGDLDNQSKINQAGRKNVDILLVPSTEGNQAQSPWHVRFAPFRAVENGISVVRPTLGGVSVALDPFGRLLTYMDYFATTDPVMVAQVPTHGVFTPYSVIGDLFGWLAVAGFAVIAGWATLIGYRSRELIATSSETQTHSV